MLTPKYPHTRERDVPRAQDPEPSLGHRVQHIAPQHPRPFARAFGRFTRSLDRYGVVKWSLIAAVIGPPVGASVALFLGRFHLVIELVSTVPHYYVLLPIALLLSTAVTRMFAPNARGIATRHLVQDIHDPSQVTWRGGAIRAISTIATVVAGGAAGLIGPSVHVATASVGVIANRLRIPEEDRRKLLVCATSAGFAAALGAPIGGSLFGIELLGAGHMTGEILAPTFIAGLTAYYMASALGAGHAFRSMVDVTSAGVGSIALVALEGALLGLCALFLIRAIPYIESVARRVRLYESIRAGAAGLIMVGLVLLTSPQYCGPGTDAIATAIQGDVFRLRDVLLKTLFVLMTLALGGTGGVIVPLMVIGATAGGLFGHVAGVDASFAAAAGMMALLSGASKAPVATSVLAAEFFGSQSALYIWIACATAFLFSGRRSVFGVTRDAVHTSRHYSTMDHSAE
jgi:H+/Cl- antiporter ClcA